jgi:nucleotide-binding universal stress UspA family protein
MTAAMRRILIAVDGSEPAHEAVDFGLELAREQDAAVVFAHVTLGFENVQEHAFGTGSVRACEVSEADREPLERAAAAAQANGVPAETELLAGDPTDEIVAYADSIDADAIVVGRRGHGKITSTLLGSVSQGILREAQRPVVVVPSKWRRVRPVAAR